MQPDLAARVDNFSHLVREALCGVAWDEPGAAVGEVELVEHAEEARDADFGGEETGGVIGEDVAGVVAFVVCL